MRLLLKPHIPGPVVNLAIASLLSVYMFYGFVSMPLDLDQSEVMFWVYAKGKIANGLSSWGGYFGAGHPASLYRAVTSHMDDPISVNYTQQRDINITNTVWNGVTVRLYEPRTKIRNGPSVVMYHGGLWITGSINNHDHIGCELAKSLGVVVVSVNYRLAPENHYPAPLDDCFVATKYMLERGENELEIDPSMVALIGLGAGGNLAAAVAQKLRDVTPNLPTPAYQVLINPLLQPFDFHTPSYQQNQYDAAFPKSLVINAWLWYGLGSEGHRKYSSALYQNQHTSASAKQSKMAANTAHTLIHRKYLHEFYTPDMVDFGNEKIWDELDDLLTDSYFAPLMTDNLKGLPKAYIVVSQYDVARDDGIMYARRLEKAGVPSTLVHYDKAVHNQLTITTRTTLAHQIMRDLTKFLITHF